MAAYAIQTSRLCKTFPGGVVAVDGMDLRIRPGCIYGLIGPNGAGKTTALRLLMGLLRPQSGTARILGENLWEAPRSVRSRVVYISQSQQVHNWMTLQELCRFAAQLYDHWDWDYARSLAQRWHLPFGQRLGTMSAGGQRTAALLLAFASRAQVLVLDEPAAGLDPIARRSLIDEIITAIAAGDERTVLFSTHLLEDLERVVDSVGIMNRGRLIVSSPLEDLQRTVKRVQVIFPGEAVPGEFAIPGALWTEVSGPVATAMTRLVNEAQLDSIRHWAGARVHVFPLGLEDILLAFYKASQAADLTTTFPLQSENEPQAFV
ncbi:MAG: ABC transporter ATP-binding protein [Verrucomicrobiota bacterium]